MGFATNVPNLDEIHPTSFKANTNIAPNPLAGPQNDPFDGFTSPGTKDASRSAAFASGENIGAQLKITSSHVGPKDTNVNFGPSGPGGHVVRPAMSK